MYGAVTNVDGRYTIQGMRTGGPYKVEISYVGYKKAVFTDIRLELGNTYVLNATLYPSSEQLGEVVVTADAKANIGASEIFYRKDTGDSDGRPQYNMMRKEYADGP